jgi:hypothetical protein
VFIFGINIILHHTITSHSIASYIISHQRKSCGEEKNAPSEISAGS